MRVTQCFGFLVGQKGFLKPQKWKHDVEVQKGCSILSASVHRKAREKNKKVYTFFVKAK